MNIYSNKNKELLFTRGQLVTGFFARAKGLLFRDSIELDEAMIFEKCKSVHTIGMRFSIDLVFLDKNKTVLKVVEHLKPYRIAGCSRAKYVLEAKSGSCLNRGILVDDKLQF